MALDLSQQEYIQRVQPELEELVRQLCAIPAPSGFEKKRAEFCRNWFVENGFKNVCIDDACNVIAPLQVTAEKPLLVIMAHTDTVFPEKDPLPFSEDEQFMYSPGVTDDTANLAVLMICARYFKEHLPTLDHGVIFVANSCEEGLGKPF